MINTGTAATANPPTNTVAGRMAYIWQFLTGNLGESAAQAAGVEGNWQVETGGTFSPTAYNPAEGAHGIGQWEGSRWTALQNFAKSIGRAPLDLTTQLLFFAKEAAQRGNLAALAKTNDPTSAATVIQSQFEVSDPASLGQRQADARSIYASASKYGTPHPLAGVPSTSSGADPLLGLPGTPSIPTPSSIGNAVMTAVTKIAFTGGGVGLILIGVNHAAKAS